MTDETNKSRKAVERPIAPSDAERASLPFTTLHYLEYLEVIEDDRDGLRDAYTGAMEDKRMWKRRAEAAEVELAAAQKWADDLLDAAEQTHRDGGAEMHRLIRTPPDFSDSDAPARPAPVTDANDPLDPDMPEQEMRLHMGEMTAQEVRIARAAIRWANSRPASVSVEEARQHLLRAERLATNHGMPRDGGTRSAIRAALRALAGENGDG